MAEETRDLRFDIYERVKLPDEVHHLDQLEELDLVPQIEIMTWEDQIVLKGHMLLTGTYGAREPYASARRFEHSIPVEIALPANRIHNLEDIRVRIEQFDMEPIDERNMNVTGVLSLSGFELVPTEDAWSAHEPLQEKATVEAEEEVFIHAVQDEQENGAPTAQAEEVPTDAVEATEAATDAEETTGSFDTADVVEVVEWTETDGTAESGEPVEAEGTGKNEIGIQFKTSPHQSPPVSGLAEELLQATAKSAPSEMLQNDERELAPAGEGELDAAEATEANRSGDEVPAEVPEADASGNDFSEKTAWKNLFLSAEKEEEKHRFSRLRMCIVQKEETLETIAERYNLNPREIILYNRLGDQELQEGQIIYIPRQENVPQ